MRTIGKRRPGSSPRGETIAVCQICDVPWPRSEMRYDSSGRLICPDDQGGLDETDLARLTVPSPHRAPPGDPGPSHSHTYDFRQSLEVVAYFTASHGSTLVDDEVVSLRAKSGKRLLEEPSAFGFSGAGPGLLEEDDRFNGEPSFVGDSATGTLLMSDRVFWGNGDYPWAFFVGRLDLLTGSSVMANDNAFQLLSQSTLRGYVAFGPGESVTVASSKTPDTEPHLFEFGVIDDVAYLIQDGVELGSAAAGPVALQDPGGFADPTSVGGWHFLGPLAFRGHWAAALLAKNPTESGLAAARTELQRIYL